LFDWTPYLVSEDQFEISFDVWVEKFRQHKLAQGISELTLKQEYGDPFKVLDSLDPDKAIAAIIKIAPNTRKRSRYCMSISALFKFAGVAINLKPYKGNYSPTTVQPRDIPTDALIQEWYFKIKTPSWQWAYGILSAYGIRPEELVLLEFDAMPVLIVRGDKSLSSDRRVYPIYPEWVDLFNLKNPILPKCKDSGKQTCKQFQRYKIPFSPLYLEEEQRLKSLIKQLSRGEFAQPLAKSKFFR
jgi:hypothetical protein